MNISKIHDVKQGFQVLQTTKHAQTAIMILEGKELSSEEMNIHEKSDQVLLLMEGELLAEIGNEEQTMKKGEVCIVPAGTPHRFTNKGQDRAVTFNVYAPPEYAPKEKG